MKGYYEVSDLGRVRRCDGTKTGRSRLKNKDGTRTPTPDKHGYLYLYLTIDGKRYSRAVHLLVARAFIGPCPPRHQAAHLDGKPWNCRADNLKYVTVKTNMSHKRLHGTQPFGEDQIGAKLTDIKVNAIFWMAAAGIDQATIGRVLNVEQTNISSVLTRKTWSHVKVSPLAVELANDIRRKLRKFTFKGRTP